MVTARPGVQSRWCPANSVTLAAQKFPHLPFSTEVSHETVAGGPLFRRVRFASAPCSVFEFCPFCVAGVALSGHF